MNKSWTKVEDEKPQVHSTIEFKNLGGEKYAGTFLNYHQFKSNEGKIFEIEEVEKWRIREKSSQ